MILPCRAGTRAQEGGKDEGNKLGGMGLPPGEGLEEHQQLNDQTTFKGIWKIAFLSHQAALGGAFHCVGVNITEQEQEKDSCPCDTAEVSS